MPKPPKPIPIEKLWKINIELSKISERLNNVADPEARKIASDIGEIALRLYPITRQLEKLLKRKSSKSHASPKHRTIRRRFY